MVRGTAWPDGPGRRPDPGAPVTRLPLPARRLAAGTALVALPLAAAVGCGSATGAAKQSVQTSLQKASDNLGTSRAASFVLRFDDPKGSLKKQVTSGKDPASSQLADVLLGGTVSFTIDPTGSTTLRDLQAAPAGTRASTQLDAVNLAMSVQADGGPLAQVRLVRGDVYLNVGLDTVQDVLRRSGSATDVRRSLDQAAQGAPGEVGPLLADVKAGKWVKIPRSAVAQGLDRQGATPTPTPSVDSTRLGNDLLAAVRPFVAVTETATSGGTRTIDVKVQAKQALKAVLAQLRTVQQSVPGLAQLDTSGLDEIGDGTANGAITITDDHFRRLTLDLASLSALAPPTPGSAAPDLTGSALALEVDDAAKEVTAPDDVSPVDVTSLVSQLAPALGGTRTS